ncbi:MAG: ribosomal RNA small subunit methyltransferase I [Bryobacteraceae bacterium]|nr:MAG: ribosomal RNA small subunit methyltransferase I [Bryobacteraceae bacterium]
MAGTLYVVATPIGNLADITHRAVDVLRSVAWIACEDTRQTRKLLERYGIEARLLSYHEHNEEQRSGELLERLEAGDDIALVSDAGTPLVSDPGYRLVRRAVERGIRVVPVPGPAAFLAALSASGLETDSFYFGGFLPRKRSERVRLLETLAPLPCTLIFYEAPHRILQTLADLEAAMPSRPVVIARELTKLHEEFLRGTARELREQLERRGSIKGEMTLLAGRPREGESPAAPPGLGREGESSSGPQRPLDAHQIRGEIARLQQQEGLPRMEAIKRLARSLGLGKREIYRLIQG